MGLLSWLKGKKPEEADAPPPPEEDVAAPEIPLEELAAGLESSEGAVRIDAARALLERWRRGDGLAAEILAPRLHELLEDSEPLLRQTALAGTRLLRKPENVERCAGGILALLADPVGQVRAAAVWSAVRLPGDTARIQVRALLTSPEESMRFAAACALSDVRDGAALPELLAAVRDEHRRQEAVSALMTLGDAACVPALAKLFEAEEEAALEPFDKTLVGAALARFGDPRGGAHLVERIEAAGDDGPIAAEWAGRLGVQDAVPALTALAEEEGDAGRGAAIRALGRLRAPGAEERLLVLAAEGEDDLRMDAAEGLAELASPAALELLRKLAAEPSELGQLCRELLVEVAANEASA